MKKISIIISLFCVFPFWICQDLYSGPPGEDAVYVGSETCSGCHSDKYDILKDRPGVIIPIADALLNNDADENGNTDFEDGLTLDGSHEFDSPFSILESAGYAPVLSKNGDNYTITIGENVYSINFILGNYWKLLFLTGIGNSDYILPVQFNVKNNNYDLYNPGRWFDFDNGNVTGFKYENGNTPVSKGNTGDSWQNLCMGCHVTGLTTMVQNEDNEWLGELGNQLSEYGTKCEACHGPGSEHTAGAFSQEDKKIVNPENLEDSQLRISVCGRCHVRGTSTGGVHEFPWDDENNKPCMPGSDVDDFYLDDGLRWLDGTSYGNYQQCQDYKLSVMFNKSRTAIVCWNCHDPHGSENKHDLLSTSDDNTICLNCHAAINNFFDNEDVINHTKHPYDPEESGLSRCTTCHLSKVARSALDYDIHSHTFEAITPERTLKLNMPNSCMVSCHKTLTVNEVLYTNDDLSDWTQEADLKIAAYLDEYAQNWWGTIMPASEIGTEKSDYKVSEQIMIELGLSNPTVRLMKSKLLLLMLTPDGNLLFFPEWTPGFAGIQYTIPYSFELPLTSLIPFVPSKKIGNYFIGFAVMHPDSNLANLTFYSEFSVESGSISMFNLSP